jgi:hypothetical protein
MNGDEKIIPRLASTLIANRFLRNCYTCGHPVVIKNHVRYEYLEPQKPHVCKETKAQRLDELNRRAV